MTGDNGPRKDPARWVRTGQRVEAKTATGDIVHATGKVIAYCDAPTVTIETDSGEHVSWRADLTEAVPTTAETDAEYVFRSNLRADGESFLSLHRLGDDVHLRLRHISSEPLRYEVAVLSPSERRALITALEAFEEPVPPKPAGMSVRVVNEPHGLSTHMRQVVAERATVGDKWGAVDTIVHCTTMDREQAASYVEGMSEYQSYLSEHGEKRTPRVFKTDGPEPPADVTAVTDRHHHLPFLIRLDNGWIWSQDATRPVGSGDAPAPTSWERAVVHAQTDCLAEVVR